MTKAIKQGYFKFNVSLVISFFIWVGQNIVIGMS